MHAFPPRSLHSLRGQVVFTSLCFVQDLPSSFATLTAGSGGLHSAFGLLVLLLASFRTFPPRSLHSLRGKGFEPSEALSQQVLSLSRLTTPAPPPDYQNADGYFKLFCQRKSLQPSFLPELISHVCLLPGKVRVLPPEMPIAGSFLIYGPPQVKMLYYPAG